MIACICGKNSFSQTASQTSGVFNSIYIKDSPELRDLTLEQNYLERAKRKIKMIIKIHYRQKDGDSVVFRTSSSNTVYALRNLAVKHYYFYNEQGVLYKKAMMPLNFRISAADSIKLNSTESIKITNAGKGFTRTLKTPITCGVLENYEDGKLVKIGKSGSCMASVLRIRAVENGDTSYIVQYNKDIVYDENNVITETIENYGNAYAHLSTTEKFDYKKRKILAERKHKTLFDSTTFVEKNETKLNKRGQVKRSKYYSTLQPKNYTLYTCKYDFRRNLDRIYITESDKDKGKKRSKFVHYYYYFEKNKIKTVEFQNLKGEIYVEFDENIQFKKVTITETGEIFTYEYFHY